MGECDRHVHKGLVSAHSCSSVLTSVMWFGYSCSVRLPLKTGSKNACKMCNVMHFVFYKNIFFVLFYYLFVMLVYFDSRHSVSPPFILVNFLYAYSSESNESKTERKKG